MFSYKEMKAATMGFHPSNKIGEGGFGSVFKVLILLFSCQELQMDTHKISCIEILFYGWYNGDVDQYGTIVQGRLQDGATVAIKVLSVELESMRGEREFISEIAALSHIKHENLVSLRGCCIEGADRFLVYENMENNSVAHTILGKSIVIPPVCV